MKIVSVFVVISLLAFQSVGLAKKGPGQKGVVATPATVSEIGVATVDATSDSFKNTQIWQVQDATRDELVKAAKSGKLEFRGRYGVYGDRTGMAIEEVVKTAHGAEAHGTRPNGLPAEMGSTAFIEPQANGTISVGMKDGHFGHGQSVILIQDTQVSGVTSFTAIHENGEYAVSINDDGLMADFGRLLEFTPIFGSEGLKIANEAMGRFHNEQFDIATPLVNIVNDLRKKK